MNIDASTKLHVYKNEQGELAYQLVTANGVYEIAPTDDLDLEPGLYDISMLP